VPPLVNLLSPQVPLAAKQLGRTTLFQTSFEWRGARRPLHLVRDSQLGAPADRERSNSFRFFLNGREIKKFQPSRRYDPCNLEARIDLWVREGRNFLVMMQSLPKNVPLAEGMPYDAIRLFGRFEVDFPYGYTTLAVLRPRPSGYVLTHPASPQELGHPQYGGIFTYSRDAVVEQVPSRTAIGFEKLHESAEIRLNGKTAGILWQPPSFLEIPARFWRKGKNRIEIRCATSPANYLLGLRRPAGFAGATRLYTISG
jgi:hypothetical protein